jgi:hypothetical protein
MELLMEPVSLILTALIGGAAAALKDTASQAVKDAYNGLRALVQQRFAGRPAAEVALAESEKKPEIWQGPLKEALSETSVGNDEKIIEAAQKLMALVDPQQAAAGKYNIQIAGNVQGLAQGDHQHVEMNFNGKRG